jgi:hypothetical protein
LKENSPSAFRYLAKAGNKISGNAGNSESLVEGTEYFFQKPVDPQVAFLKPPSQLAELPFPAF